MSEVVKDRNYYATLRIRLNEIFRELQQAPQEYKMGYWHTVPAILNAYREGDISFEQACSLLKMADAKEVKTATVPDHPIEELEGDGIC